MAGDSANTAVWGDADVLIAPITAVIPVGNAAFSVDWVPVGLLDPGQGFQESVEVESTEHRAWGAGVIATTYTGQSTTRTFTALEENEMVMSLLYDTTGVTFGANSYSGDLGVKDFTSRLRIAFVTYSGDEERRLTSKNYATIAATNAGSESEEALMTRGFTATIYPDSNNILWTTYRGASL